MTGVVKQVSVSPGGMPKSAIPVGTLTAAGFLGDHQKNRKYHGGPDRAVCLFSVELYDRLRDRGIDLSPGSVGENLTVEGIDLDALSVGNRLHVGECLIEITDVRTPCRNLNRWHPQLLKTMKGHSGWVAKVLKPGSVSPGQPVKLMVD